MWYNYAEINKYAKPKRVLHIRLWQRIKIHLIKANHEKTRANNSCQL